tara:strand:+ start:92 stop:508 length:417 start_codon:yes stop_codon:yes gene_type:complete
MPFIELSHPLQKRQAEISVEDTQLAEVKWNLRFTYGKPQAYRLVRNRPFRLAQAVSIAARGYPHPDLLQLLQNRDPKLVDLAPKRVYHQNRDPLDCTRPNLGALLTPTQHLPRIDPTLSLEPLMPTELPIPKLFKGKG